MKIAKHISLALFVIFSTAIYAFTEEFPPVAVAEDPTKLFWENIFFLIIDYLWAVYLFLMTICIGYAYGLKKPLLRIILILIFLFSAYRFSHIGYLYQDLEGDYNEIYCIKDWLIESPGSLFLYLYFVLSFLILHYGLSWGVNVQKRHRLLAFCTTGLALCVFAWGAVIVPFQNHRNKPYGHHSTPESNPMGEHLQRQWSIVGFFISNSSYPKGDGLKSRTEESGLFDPNCYFRVLTNIWLEPGYEMDYSVCSATLTFYPQIYLKECKTAKTSAEWHLQVHLNGTPESYLEYATLYLFADQFYVAGHAWQSSYGWLILSKTEYDKLLNDRLPLGPDAKKKACNLDFFPKVQVNQDTAEVSFCTFSNWRGLVLQTFIIERAFPHRILNQTRQTLIKYDWGIII